MAAVLAFFFFDAPDPILIRYPQYNTSCNTKLDKNFQAFSGR